MTHEPCPNIGPAGIRQRRRAAASMLVAGLALGAVALFWHWPLPARAVAGLFFLSAGVSFMQTVERTCVAFVAAGIQDVDDSGVQRVVDAARMAAQRRQAGRVFAKGLLLGLVPAVGLFLLPA